MMHKEQKIKHNIVVIPDKFKGTLTSSEFIESLEVGVNQLETNENESICLHSFPMADGGEGSLEVLENELIKRGVGCERINRSTVNHLGGEIETYFLYDSDSKTAYLEMALVVGLELIPDSERNIMRSSTFGLSELFRVAIEELRARKLVLFVGGSGTNDGGFGLLSGLGFRYINTSVFKNKDVPSFIGTVTEINNGFVQQICPHLYDVEFIVASDVTNPLLGPNGATRVYAPQKGASPQQIEVFEKSMENWADILEAADDKICAGAISGSSETLPTPARFLPGAGAAGGIAFAMAKILGAKIVSAWDLISEVMEIDSHIAESDLVVTGEGRFDKQSLNGKLVYKVGQVCKKYNKPLILLCGESLLSIQEARAAGITRILSIAEYYGSIDKAKENTKEGVTALVKEIFKQD